MKRIDIAIALLPIVSLIQAYNCANNFIITTYILDGLKVDYTINDMKYAVCSSVILVLCMVIINYYRRSVETLALLGLAIGKLIDEFTTPFGYGFSELLWNITVALYYTYKKYSQWKANNTTL